MYDHIPASSSVQVIGSQAKVNLQLFFLIEAPSIKLLQSSSGNDHGGELLNQSRDKPQEQRPHHVAEKSPFVSQLRST